jgi:hypothetical protein
MSSFFIAKIARIIRCVWAASRLSNISGNTRGTISRHAEFVDEPSALAGRSVRAQPLPEFVDLVLLAIDDQRNGLIEAEL